MRVKELVAWLGFETDLSGADRFDARMKQSETAAKRLVEGLRGFTVKMAVVNEITDSIVQLAQKIGAAALAIPLAGDRMAQSLAVINNELENTGLAAEVYEKLYQSVRQTGSDIDDTARSFARYQGAMADNNRTTDETITLVTGLQAAMTAAGMAASEVNSVTTQLGQALASGTLSGDEFKSLRENLPGLVRYLRDQLGMTGAEMKKAAEDQKLTTDKLIEPLLAYARMSNEKLAALPPSLTREWTNFVTTIERFGAQIDHAFKLSERLARAIRWVSDAIERWRQYIPMLAAFVDQLGSLKSAAYALATTLALAFGPPLLGMLATAVAALTPLLIIFTSLAAAFLLIEDFFSWMQGKDSLFGRAFGDFDVVFGPLKAKLAELKALIAADFGEILPAVRAVFEAIRPYLPTLDEVKAAFAALKDAVVADFNEIAPAARAVAAVLGPVFAAVFDAIRTVVGLAVADFREIGPASQAVGAALSAVAAAAVEAWRAFRTDLGETIAVLRTLADLLRGALVGAFDGVTGAIQRMWDVAKGAFAWIKENMPTLGGEGTGTGSDPAGQAQRRGNFGNRGAGTGFYENVLPQSFIPQVSPGAMVTPAAVVNAPQTNYITNDVKVTATGASGAEVAAGASRGVSQAARDMVADLGSVARSLGTAFPRSETAAA